MVSNFYVCGHVGQPVKSETLRQDDRAVKTATQASACSGQACSGIKILQVGRVGRSSFLDEQKCSMAG